MESNGIDVGYSWTKSHKGILFPSRIKEHGDMLLGSEAVYKGERYNVGYGRPEWEINKTKTDLMKICTLYAICKTTNDNEIVLCTGLPVGQYAAQKQALRESFSKDNDITVGGVYRPLKILDVKVYPQGAGALYATNISGNCILVDVGGRTIDIAYFEMLPDRRRSLKKFSTLYCGMLSLYSKCIAAINSRYDIALTTEDGENIIRFGSLFYEGQKQDLGFLSPIIKSHIQELKDELTLNYPIKTTDVYLCGGGAPFYKKALGYPVLDNAQFSNAIGFYHMGGGK